MTTTWIRFKLSAERARAMGLAGETKGDHLVTLEVHLDALSSVARRVATGIATTDSTQPYGRVYLRTAAGEQQIWQWEELQAGELPEDLLERQAKAMLAHGEILDLPLEPHLNTTEAAARLGVGPRRIVAMIHAWQAAGQVAGPGRLPATQDEHGHWRIRPENLGQVARRSPQGGRPRKKESDS